MGENRRFLLADPGGTALDAFQIAHTGIILAKNRIRSEEQYPFTLIRQAILYIYPFHFNCSFIAQLKFRNILALARLDLSVKFATEVPVLRLYLTG